MESKLSRKQFLKLAASAAAGMGLAACAPVAPPAAPAAAPGATEAPQQAAQPQAAAPAAGKVELQWWSFGLGLPDDTWPHGKWEQSLADAYQKENPGVTIAYQAMGWDSLTKMATAITAGNPPNLVLRGGIDQLIYAKQGDCLFEIELPQELQDDLPAGWADGMKYQGKNYMVPFYVLCNGMVVNLTIAEEAGASDLVPKAPERAWNFDQYLELMKKVAGERNGKQYWGNAFASQQSNPFFYWPEQVLSWCWGTDTVRNDGGKWACMLGEEAGLKWLQWMQDLYFVHKVIPNPAGQTTPRWDYWDQGTLLSGIGPDIGWTHRTGQSVDAQTLVVTDSERKFDWCFVQSPINPGVAHPSYWGGPLLDVNIVPYKTKDTNQAKPTQDFALWLVNKDNQKWLAQYLLPVRQSALEGVTDPVLTWMYKYWIPNGRQRAEANGGRAREVCEALELVIQKIYQQATPTEAVADFCKTVDGLEWIV